MMRRKMNSTVCAIQMGTTACLVILLLNGCFLVSHRPIPIDITLTPSPKNNEVVHLSIQPQYVTEEKKDGNASMETLPVELAILQRYLEKYSTFSSAVISSSVPQKGFYIVLTRTTQPAPSVTPLYQFMRLSCPVAVMTLFTLPCYDEDVSTLRYEVYADDQLLKSYVYDVTRRQLLWWGVVPVFWLNWMTTTYKEACENITMQFVAGARRDGYL